MSNIEHWINENGTTWVDGEPYTPLSQRERTFLDVSIEAQKERDEARQQLAGAVDAIEEALDDLRDFGTDVSPPIAHARQVLEGALAAKGGGR